MPLIVWTVYGRGEPAHVMEVSVPEGPCVGSSVCSPLALAATLVTNVSVPLFHDRPRIVDAFLPSVQSSSCLYEMIEIPRDWADETIASAVGCGAPLSLCTFTPNAP